VQFSSKIVQFSSDVVQFIKQFNLYYSAVQFSSVQFIFKNNSSVHLNCFSVTSAERAFGSSCFQYSAPVREPKHIGARPKGHRFLPRLRTEAIESPSASVLRSTRGHMGFFLYPFGLGFGCTRGHMGFLF